MGKHAFTEPIDSDVLLAATAVDGKGFHPVGTLAPGELYVLPDDDDEAVPTWGGEVVRTLQDRRELSFSFKMEPWQVQLWHNVFGVPLPKPAPPTAREALVDLWDALRALVLAVAVAVRERVEDVYDAVLDGVEGAWYSLRDHVTDRWYVLTIWQFRRKLVGPLVRFWDADYSHLATMPRRRETWREWAVRQAQLPKRVWRG